MKTIKNGARSHLSASILIATLLLVTPAQAQDAGAAAPVVDAAAETAATAPAAAATPDATAQPATAVAVVTPTPAAPPAPPQTGLESLRDQLMAILVPVFGLFIGGLAVLLLNKAKVKLGLDISEKHTLAWRDLARSAALRGAEWARKKAKEATDGKKIPGPEVLDVGVNWATQMAVQQGLPEMARAKLEGLIESELFALRLEEPAPNSDPYANVATKV